MKVRIVWVGKTKNPCLSELCLDYASRIQHFLPVEFTEVKEPKVKGSSRIHTEGEKLLATLRAAERVIALDPQGKSWTSELFATFLQEHMAADSRNITFVVGGFGGLSEAVKKRADVLWSLSPLTHTHDLARVILLEQLYRALSIIRNLPYAK